MTIGKVVWLKTPSRAGSLPHWVSGVCRICDHWRPDVGASLLANTVW